MAFLFQDLAILRRQGLEDATEKRVAAVLQALGGGYVIKSYLQTIDRDVFANKFQRFWYPRVEQ